MRAPGYFQCIRAASLCRLNIRTKMRDPGQNGARIRCSGLGLARARRPSVGQGRWSYIGSTWIKTNGKIQADGCCALFSKVSLRKRRFAQGNERKHHVYNAKPFNILTNRSAICATLPERERFSLSVLFLCCAEIKLGPDIWSDYSSRFVDTTDRSISIHSSGPGPC